MAKQLFKVVEGTKVATATKEQAEFYNREPSALTIGTVVVLPAQKAHIRTRSITINNVSRDVASKSLYAYVFDKAGALLETKEISMSQFQRRSYGVGDITVNAIRNERGLMRGESTASESNIIGQAPNFKVIVEGNKNVVTLAEAAAYEVSKGDIHNLARIEDQRPDGLYDFKTKMMGSREVLDLLPARLPNLTTIAVPTGYDTLPGECATFQLKA